MDQVWERRAVWWLTTRTVLCKDSSSSLDVVTSLRNREVQDGLLQECAGLEVWVRLSSHKGPAVCPFHREKNERKWLSQFSILLKPNGNKLWWIVQIQNQSWNQCPQVTLASPGLLSNGGVRTCLGSMSSFKRGWMQRVTGKIEVLCK